METNKLKFAWKTAINSYLEEVIGETVQQMEIYYRAIGNIKLLKMTKMKKERYIKTFECKKRAHCLMQLTPQKWKL